MGGRGNSSGMGGKAVDFDKGASDSILYEGRADLTPTERDYLFQYSVMSGTPNSYLRRQYELSSLQDLDVIKDGIPSIDAAIARSDLKRNINVYRSVNAARLPNDLKVGDIIEDKAFNSTSIHRDVVEKYGALYPNHNRAVLKIEVPSGKGRGIYIQDIAAGDQYEFLIKRGSKYKVRSIQSDGTINVVMI